MIPAFLKQTQSGVTIAIKLQPRASRQQILGLHGAELKVSVTAPPVDSAANIALTAFLADVLAIPRSSVEILKGHSSRHKVVLIADLPLEAVASRLQPYLR